MNNQGQNTGGDTVDYTQKRTGCWSRAVNNIKRVMWTERPKDSDFMLRAWLDAKERRAILMQEFPEFLDAVVELAEAEVYYQTVKNLKKKDPPRYYEGRDRVFLARHKVKAMETEDYGYGHDPMRKRVAQISREQR